MNRYSSSGTNSVSTDDEPCGGLVRNSLTRVIVARTIKRSTDHDDALDAISIADDRRGACAADSALLLWRSGKRPRRGADRSFSVLRNNGEKHARSGAAMP